jgi:hypothetical protein
MSYHYYTNLYHRRLQTPSSPLILATITQMVVVLGIIITNGFRIDGGAYLNSI